MSALVLLSGLDAGHVGDFGDDNPSVQYCVKHVHSSDDLCSVFCCLWLK